MGLTFEPLGKFIHEVDVRNTDLSVTKLMGVNLSKQMMPSVANIVGTDLSVYKVVNKGQFACKLMSVGRDACLPIALKRDDEPVIISSAYYAFEVNDENEMLSEYLMMCFLRPDFDRELWFRTGGDVRGGVTWDTFCEMPIPYIPISEQRKIVHDYQVITNRIELLRKMNEILENLLYADFQRRFQDGKDAALKGTPLDGWKTCELALLTDFQYGKMVPEDERSETGYPIFSGYGITGYYHEYMFEAPCIVVLARGVSGTGEVRISPKYSYITNLSIALSLKDNDYFAYLYEYLAHDNLRALDSGSAQSMITIDSLNKYNVAVPSTELAKEYNDAFSKMYVVIENNQNEIERLNRLSTVLLQHFAKGA